MNRNESQSQEGGEAPPKKRKLTTLSSKPAGGSEWDKDDDDDDAFKFDAADKPFSLALSPKYSPAKKAAAASKKEPLGESNAGNRPQRARSVLSRHSRFTKLIPCLNVNRKAIKYSEGSDDDAGDESEYQADEVSDYAADD